MKYMNRLLLLCVAWIALNSCNTENKPATTHVAHREAHRPQIHFSPASGWMNDPNGLVFHNGVYHMFYQFYPDSTVWGPMHWAHATSKDLINWVHEPIALYPDSLGYIFSGSAVVDKENTSGFGNAATTPLVAIFTHHHPDGEKQGRVDYQVQSLAYSLDDGKTWTKYAGNPVLKNPGIKDFRDPKVMWHEQSKKWIMSLATLDCISFYSSPDLKNWSKESEFGKAVGAHGGVWECPDLFPLTHEGKTVWVLLVSINPGGPNGGSATQYFTGDFDGKKFTPYQTDIRWIDWGPDNYAGVTWFNTGDRRIFIGWMSNWDYGQQVPTKTWRSAMTLPRELSLEKIGERYFLKSGLATEVDALSVDPVTTQELEPGNHEISKAIGTPAGPAKLRLEASQADEFSITLSNAKGEKLVVGYEKAGNRYFIDRRVSGEVGFGKNFNTISYAPRIAEDKNQELTIVIDDASAEVFADEGLTVMTGIFFPSVPYSTITINNKMKMSIGFLRLKGKN